MNYEGLKLKKPSTSTSTHSKEVFKEESQPSSKPIKEAFQPFNEGLKLKKPNTRSQSREIFKEEFQPPLKPIKEESQPLSKPIKGTRTQNQTQESLNVGTSSMIIEQTFQLPKYWNLVSDLENYVPVSFRCI